MEGVKNKVKVNILGGEYNILTDEDESRVQAIAAFVDKQITDTKAMSPQMTTMNAAILALLNLSEELYATKSELDEYKKKEDELDKSADAAKELESLKQAVFLLSLFLGGKKYDCFYMRRSKRRKEYVRPVHI